MGRTFDWNWIFIPLFISIFVFFVAWGFCGLGFYIHFELTTELGTYSELTVPIGMETKYVILAFRLGVILAMYISILIFIIGFLICCFSDT